MKLFLRRAHFVNFSSTINTKTSSLDKEPLKIILFFFLPNGAEEVKRNNLLQN